MPGGAAIPARARAGRLRAVLAGVAMTALAGGLVPAGSAGATTSGGLGSLDLSFGNLPTGQSAHTGVASLSQAGNLAAVAYDAADGDVVAAGQDTAVTPHQLAIGRFSLDGSPDGSFSSSPSAGLALAGLGSSGSGSAAETVAVYPSGANGYAGDVVAAGWQEPQSVEQPALVRYVPASQSFDSSFDSAVANELSQVGLTGGSFQAVAIEPPTAPGVAGDVVAAGTVSTAGAPLGEVGVFVFDASGGLVASYLHQVGNANYPDTVGGVAVDPTSGAVFVTGGDRASDCGSTKQEAFVLELAPSTFQPPSSGFGAGGLVQLDDCSSSSGGLVANAVAVNSAASDVPYLVAAGTDETAPTSAVLIGLTASGSPASSFGFPASGYLSQSALSRGLAVAYVEQSPTDSTPAGVVLGGPSQSGSPQYASVALYGAGTPTALDEGFGSSGVSSVVVCTSGGATCGSGLAVQPDGNVLVAGDVEGTPPATQDSLSVARLVDRAVTVIGPGTVAVTGAGQSATFQVSLVSATLGQASVSVQYATADGSARAGTNYTSASGTITFPCSSSEPAGVTCSGDTASVVVPLLFPAGASGDLAFSLDLSNPQNAGLISTSASATIAYPAASPPSSGSGGSSSTPTTTTTSPPSSPVAGRGYWVVTANGRVFAFGDARNYGSVSPRRLGGRVAAIAPAAAGEGYWIVSTSGRVFAFGTARSYGSVPRRRLRGRIVAIAVAPRGTGYLLVSSTGAVYGFGRIRSHGSVPRRRLDGPIVAVATTSNGGGYWLASTRGRVYAFGNARSRGSVRPKLLKGSVSGLARTASNGGYWIVSTTGQVFAFGNAHRYGSVPRKRLRGRASSIVPTPNGRGYWVVTSAGRIYPFGDARSYGSPSTRFAVAGMAST
ncbi:MAG TPA: Calx-beta domain-containing protein [Acidimicrobiales bacterium]|nr:Calx-beta domain-containing protein [Acidimicrobiales bacterium]